MTFKNFLNLTTKLQKQEQVISTLYDQSIDLINFVEPYNEIITTLIYDIYGEEGGDWFFWYCYENDFGQKKLEAWDKNKQPICYSTKSLWEYLEANHSKNKFRRRKTQK